MRDLDAINGVVRVFRDDRLCRGPVRHVKDDDAAGLVRKRPSEDDVARILECSKTFPVRGPGGEALGAVGGVGPLENERPSWFHALDGQQDPRG
jgi:hypothetical protein